MEDKIGQDFEGVISGVTQHGIFVELLNTIEGFVRVQDFEGDSYQFHENKFLLTNGHNSFAMGQSVKVKVAFASAVARRVDFVLI